MTIEIDIDQAREALVRMVEELTHCPPEHAYEAGIGIAGAHYYACQIGVLTEEELHTMTPLIKAITKEQSEKHLSPEAAP